MEAELNSEKAKAGAFKCDADGLKKLIGQVWTKITGGVLGVIALLRDHDSEGWRAEIKFSNMDGVEKTICVPMDELSDRAVTRLLRNNGFFVMHGRESDVGEYLYLRASMSDTPRVTTFDRLGFVESRAAVDSRRLLFVMPSAVLSGRDGELTEPVSDLRFHPKHESSTYACYTASGTLESWRAAVAPLGGNPIFVSAICAGLAGPFVGMTGQGGFIFHFFGMSSSGKTTATQLAASVWGRAADEQGHVSAATLVRSWLTTSNGMELMLASHSGILLPLDEIGASGESMMSVYSMTNGVGKTRMNENLGQHKTNSWSLLVISNGEISIQDKVEASENRRANAGETIRALDIPVDALTHARSGCAADERRMVEQVKRELGSSFGTAGPAFISALLATYSEKAELVGSLREDIDQCQAAWIEAFRIKGRELAAPQCRALKQFALLREIGLAAVNAGLLPFSEDEVASAIAACMNAWLAAAESLSEEEQTRENIKEYYISNRHQLLAYKDVQSTPEAAGRRNEGILYGELMLLSLAQLKRAIGGGNVERKCKALRNSGVLKSEEGHRYRYRVLLPALFGHRRVNFRAIDLSVLFEGDAPEPAATVNEIDRLLT